MVYFIKFFLFLNDYLNTDRSTHDKLEEQVLPPSPTHLLPAMSTQTEEPAVHCGAMCLEACPS